MSQINARDRTGCFYLSKSKDTVDVTRGNTFVTANEITQSRAQADFW